MRTATEHQNKIGWFAFLTGRVSWFWTENQRLHFQRKKIDKLPRNWTAALIKQAFLVSWDLWKDRNNIKHSTPMAAKNREMAKLDAEIDELRQVSMDNIPAHDQKLLKLERNGRDA